MNAYLPASAQRRTKNFGAELRELARLGGPIAFVQVGLNALSFVDACFLGHYKSSALPAMALGNTLVWLVLATGMGFVMAVDPLLSQAIGAREPHAVTRQLLRGAVLAFALSIPAALSLLPAPLWLDWLGQKPDLIPGAATYARISSLGVLPFFGFSLLRTFLSAHSRIAPQILVIVIGNLLNALLDWMWIFGRIGCSEHGIAGSAWATVVGRWFMFLMLIALSWRDLAPHVKQLASATVRRSVCKLRPLLNLFRLGAPIGGQLALEMGVFALTLLLIGHMDDALQANTDGGPRLGGHQVALQLASLTYMLPLGISMAAAVRVGWATGRGDAAAVLRTTVTSMSAGGFVMTFAMALFLFLPTQLTSLLTDDLSISRFAVALIPIAGVFQIFDGLQVTAIGCLRGMGDMRTPFWANVIGYWVLALPLGCWLSMPFGLNLGPQGLWWGLTAGLFLVACAMLFVLRARCKTTTSRLHID
jgi:MATE family multidrug resistance protein